jgi:hypothetical protein
VVELLTGSPPYFDLQPMPALFAIVRDQRPPIPAGVTPELKNFLALCFQKDPEARPSAAELRRHDWLKDVTVPTGPTGAAAAAAAALARRGRADVACHIMQCLPHRATYVVPSISNLIDSIRHGEQ